MGKRPDFSASFRKTVNKTLRESVDLRQYSNFRIGGRADFFFEASSIDDLTSAVRTARSRRIPYFIIGGGFNILFDDEGYRGLIIKNGARGLQSGGRREEIDVSAGERLSELVRVSAEMDLEGLEFLAGIPGTVGGALFGNAGAFGQNIGNFLKRAVLFNEKDREIIVPGEYFGFDYRYSLLKKKHDVVLKAVFELRAGDRRKIFSLIEKNLEMRKEKHPSWETACAGSFFKNPVLPDGRKVPAGYLLEKAGAKGLRKGEAAVFPGHANFIINLGQATARDVLSLSLEMKRRVREKFGVELEEEVIYLPASFSMP